VKGKMNSSGNSGVH